MIRPITAAAGLCLAGAAVLMPTPAMAAAPDIRLCVQVPDSVKAGASFEVAASDENKHIVETFAGPVNGPDSCGDPVEVAAAPGTFTISAAVLDTGCPALNIGDDCHVPTFSHFKVQRELGSTQTIYSPDSTAHITVPSSNYPDGGSTTVTAVFIKA